MFRRGIFLAGDAALRPRPRIGFLKPPLENRSCHSLIQPEPPFDIKDLCFPVGVVLLCLGKYLRIRWEDYLEERAKLGCEEYQRQEIATKIANVKRRLDSKSSPNEKIDRLLLIDYEEEAKALEMRLREK